MDYSFLVNKDNTLSRDYIPENLVDTNSRVIGHLDPDHKVLLVEAAFVEFREMRKQATLEGYDIEIDSAYRSYDYQKLLLENYLKKYGEKAYSFVALPGSSEHQTGLALDFSIFVDGKYLNDINDSQQETVWIHNNCYRFGFILRYPKNKKEITNYIYEPWHIRYVGKQIAFDIYEKNLTLEEYHHSKQLKKVF